MILTVYATAIDGVCFSGLSWYTYCILTNAEDNKIVRICTHEKIDHNTWKGNHDDYYHDDYHYAEFMSSNHASNFLAMQYDDEFNTKVQRRLVTIENIDALRNPVNEQIIVDNMFVALNSKPAMDWDTHENIVAAYQSRIQQQMDEMDEAFAEYVTWHY